MNKKIKKNEKQRFTRIKKSRKKAFSSNVFNIAFCLPNFLLRIYDWNGVLINNNKNK